MPTADTASTLEALKKATGANMAKASNTYTQSTGIVTFDLQGPAKNLYLPAITPIKLMLNRPAGVGPATNWKQVSALVGSGYDSFGGVPEGVRAGAMSVTVVPKAASYFTIGEEEQVTFEAINAAMTFEDLRATATMRLLVKLFQKEEYSLIGGNNSILLGTTPTPTFATATTGGTIAAGTTWSIICVALTYEGYFGNLGTPVATGLTQQKTVTSQDNSTFTINGGCAIKSAASTAGTTTGSTSTITAAVAPVTGAMGYAWYVGATAGAERFQSITTTAQVTFTSINTTGQLASALTGTDYSRNQSLMYDGLLSNAFTSGSGAYVNYLTNGAKLTASGQGSVNEIDAVLQSMWDNYRVTPRYMFVNSQQRKDISKYCLIGSSTLTSNYQIVVPQSDAGNIVANQIVNTYYNPFALDGRPIQIVLHPNIPSGTILFFTDDLPVQYQSSEVPQVAEVKVRRDYYQIDWPLVTRAQQMGVYSEQVLAVYAPFTLGILSNITPG